MLQCDECNLWRLFHVRHKLTTQEPTDLHIATSDVSLTCGAQYQDMNLLGQRNKVSKQQTACWEPTEKLYS